MRRLDLHTRWAREADTSALLALFSRSFGHPMSEVEWAWKYRFAPTPGTVCLDGERIVAFNGGMPRRCYDGMADFDAVQMGDVMVDPDYRGILTRRGPFYHVVQAFFGEAVGGEAHHRYRYAFGFPHARHARLGRALSLYCQPDVIRQASWLATPRRPWRYTARRLTRLDAHSDGATAVNVLWAAMRQALGDCIIGERHATWMEHRYLNAPGRDYAIWLVHERLTGRPLGVCVLRHRAGDFASNTTDGTSPDTELLDIVAPPPNMAAVVAVARHITARAGDGCLGGWLTPAVAAALAPSRPAVKNTDVVVPGSAVNGQTQGMKPAGRWWLMSGDTDFK